MDVDNRAVEFALSLCKNKKIEIEPDGLLWHYTDTQGFKGIVRNRTIRLSHPSFLNDPSELEHANLVYKEMLNTFADSKGNLAQEFVRGYQGYEKNEEFSGKRDSNIPFVASFCEGQDQLDPWRQYGDDGRGFSLGFRVKELKDILARQVSKSTYFLVYRVIYDRNEQDGITTDILNFFLNEFRNLEDNSVTIRDIYELLRIMLDFFTPFFKDPSYENEQECRLVLQGFPIDPSKMKFLARRGYFKPYIDLEIGIDEDEAFPLQTVVIGPAAPSTWSERSLRMFLSNQDFDVQIERSAIPYRGK